MWSTKRAIDAFNETILEIIRNRQRSGLIGQSDKMDLLQTMMDACEETYDAHKIRLTDRELKVDDQIICPLTVD